MGLASIALLIFTDKMHEKLHLYFMYDDMIHEVQISLLRSHLVLEEIAHKDPLVDIENVRTDLDLALNTVNAMLFGGSTFHGKNVPVLNELNCRSYMLSLKQLILEIRKAADDRFMSGMEMSKDQYYDELFSRSINETDRIIDSFETLLSEHEADLNRLFLSALITWSAILLIAILGLLILTMRWNRTQMMLQKSEEHFRSVADTAHDAIITANSKGSIIYWNRAAENIFGYSHHEAIHKPITSLMSEGAGKAHEHGFRQAEYTGKSRITETPVERVGVRKDGSEVPIEMSLSKWNAGSEIFFTGIIRDITDRKLAEEELNKHREKLEDIVAERTYKLRESYERLEMEIEERKQAEMEMKNMAAFAELNPSPVLRFDTDGRVLMANPAAVEILGSESLTGQLLKSVIPGSEGIDLAACIRDGEIISHTAKIGGRHFHFLFRGLPYLGVGQIYSSDITEQKMAEAKTIRASQLASLGELAAGVAHEINNPINGIINFAQMLVDILKEGSRENEIADQIMHEGDRIANIVTSLLSFARHEQEERTSVYIQDIVSDCMSLTKAQMRKEGIKTKLDIPSDLPSINAHFQKIEQVFLNIINNARYALNQKYTSSHNDKTIKITCSLVEIESKQYIRISILDQGVGIPDELSGNIMNPFFSTKPRGTGTGLGLSISHGIIVNHGGNIRIESTEGEFTNVIIELPVKKQSEGQKERQ